MYWRVFAKLLRVVVLAGTVISSCQAGLVQPVEAQHEWCTVVRLFQEQKYQESLVISEQIEPKGFAVWYLIGESYFMLNNYAEALAAYRRAQYDIRFSTVTLLMNALEKVHERLHKPFHARTEFLRVMGGLIPLLLLQVIVLLCWLLTIYTWYNRSSSMWLWVLIGILTSMLLLGTAFIRTRKYAIVKVASAPMMIAPDKRYATKKMLNYGDELVIEQIFPEWYKVRFVGIDGWLSHDMVEFIA